MHALGIKILEMVTNQNNWKVYDPHDGYHGNCQTWGFMRELELKKLVDEYNFQEYQDPRKVQIT